VGDLNVIDRFMATFIRYIDSGFGLLNDDVARLSSILIGIDITLAGLFWVMDSEANVLGRLLKKILYVGVFALILNQFSALSDIIYRSFAGLGLAATSNTLTPDDLLKPGRLAGTGFEAAWPLLKRYGFPGTVFLVAGEMGGSSTWDRDLGETAPLMSWREARRLQSRGVQFGSHTVTHPMLTSLSNADVVREAARSRMLIAEQLGSPPAAIAYPYGDSDGAIAHLMGACGYTFGLTADAGHAELERSLLLMPRIEVRGDQPFEEFVAKLKDVTIAA